MTIEEYLNMPFKTGSDGKEYTLKDELPSINRKQEDGLLMNLLIKENHLLRIL